MSGDAAAIAIAGLRFRYGPGGPWVLEDIDLTLEAKGFLGLIGPNGGGKTSLLRLVCGLDRPQAGSIRVFGQSPAKAARRIGYVPQRAALDENLPHSVMDLVLTGRLAQHSWGWGYRRADRELARAALERVGAVELADRRVSTCSGGQRQRILIARALAAEAELLILDEPLNGVDAHHEASLMHLLQELNRHLAIVLVSHDIGFVCKHVQSVACLNRRLALHRVEEVSAGIIDEQYLSLNHAHDCPIHGHHHVEAEA